jgi:hypothetical protein
LVEDMNETINPNTADVILRPTHDGAWSVEIPHAERAGATFVTFASDPNKALRLAMLMRPQSRIAICVADDGGPDWYSSL